MQVDSARPSGANAWLRSRTGLALCGFLLIAAFLLLTEHTAHVFGALPYLLVLLCPLVHLFMHGRHGDGRSGHPENDSRRPAGGPR